MSLGVNDDITRAKLRINGPDTVEMPAPRRDGASTELHCALHLVHRRILGRAPLRHSASPITATCRTSAVPTAPGFVTGATIMTETQRRLQPCKWPWGFMAVTSDIALPAVGPDVGAYSPAKQRRYKGTLVIPDGPAAPRAACAADTARADPPSRERLRAVMCCVRDATRLALMYIY